MGTHTHNTDVAVAVVGECMVVVVAVDCRLFLLDCVDACECIAQ